MNKKSEMKIKLEHIQQYTIHLQDYEIFLKLFSPRFFPFKQINHKRHKFVTLNSTAVCICISITATHKQIESRFNTIKIIMMTSERSIRKVSKEGKTNTEMCLIVNLRRISSSSFFVIRTNVIMTEPKPIKNNS